MRSYNAGSIEDQLALEYLLFQFAQAVDSGDGALLEECFVPDGVLTGPIFTWRGGFAQRLNEHRGNSPIESKTIGVHHVFNHLYVVQDVIARGVSYIRASLREGAEGARTYRNMHMRYHDELVKREGRWRFARREFEILGFTGPHALQWAPVNRRK